MNTKRLIVLGFAGVMATAAALLARGMMGGGTPKVEAKVAPPVAMSEVLVANANLQPGQALTTDQVRWEKWPSRLGRFHPSSPAQIGGQHRRSRERHRGARAAHRRPAHHQHRDRAWQRRRLHGGDADAGHARGLHHHQRPIPAPAASSCPMTASM